MAALLLRRSPRSDDLERGEPGPPLHPITGTFADATHAKDFAARCFRSAFPLHALLLITSAVSDTYFYCLSSTPSIASFTTPLFDWTFLLLRIGLHRSSDHSRAQQLGSAAWARCMSSFGPWPPPSNQVRTWKISLGRAPWKSALWQSLVSGARCSTHRMGSASRRRPPSHW